MHRASEFCIAACLFVVPRGLDAMVAIAGHPAIKLTAVGEYGVFILFHNLFIIVLNKRAIIRNSYLTTWILAFPDYPTKFIAVKFHVIIAIIVWI